MAITTKKTTAEIEQERMEFTMNVIAERAAFYRANPHRFAKDCLGINLRLFQQILLMYWFQSTHVIFLASRGLGKTYMLAVFCVIKCILFPGIKIVIASKTLKQANEVINKVLTILAPNSAFLRSEIDWKETSDSINGAKIVFKNNSRMVVVAANENARSQRCNILIVDEFRMVDEKNIVATVLRRFMTDPRRPGYLDKPEYAHMQEPNQELYASSCYYEEHESFLKSRGYVINMVDGNQFFICGLPYQLAIKENLLMRSQIEEEKSEAGFSETTWLMEMDCLWLGTGSGGLYNFRDIEKNRILPYPWLPLSERGNLKDTKIQIPTKTHREKRIMSVDVALMASTKRNNDATSIFINSMRPADKGRYMNNIVYTENIEGIRTDDLALHCRRLFAEFDCDYLVIDCKGLGLGVLDILLKEQLDPHSGKMYGALNVCNNDELADRCTDRTAPKVIWAIMGSSQFNSDCTIILRDAFIQGSVRLLQKEYDFDDYCGEISGFTKMDVEARNAIRLPYCHTTLLINELVNLSYEVKGSNVKVKEKAGARKDRYSSLSYNIYVAKEIERKERRKLQTGNDVMAGLFDFRKPTLK